MGATHGRAKFLARVAGNSLDIATRELNLGSSQRDAEHRSLNALLGCTGSLAAQRWRLVHGLRDSSIGLDHAGLAAHLRNAVVNQLAIDQPSYSGFKTAMRRPRSST
jgi:hypothetical protein